MNRYLAVLFVAALLLAILPAAPGGAQSEPLKPINLDKVNTTADEDDPHLTADGLRLLYTSRKKGRSDILMATRAKKDQSWSAGKQLPELKDSCDFRSVFLTPDGKYPQHLIFATNYDPEAKDLRGDNYDIYYLIRQGPRAEFTTKTAIISVCTEADELHPWMMPDGRTFYFSRKDRDGWHVYVAIKPAGGGALGKPVRVDLPTDFHHATLTPGGQTMYLQGPLDKQRWGLFRSTQSGGKWSKPEPLTGLNNSEGPRGDMSPNLSRDGSLLYFASDRPGGKGGLDLYAIPTAQLEKRK